MTGSSTILNSFESVEHLDEVCDTLGWPLRYRQIEPGSFSSAFSHFESDSWFLLEERSSRLIEVEAGAPSGMYVMALVEGEPLVVNGQSLNSDQFFLQSPRSSLRVTVPAGTRITQMGMAAEQYEELTHTVAPWLTPSHGCTTIYLAATGRAASIRRAMRAALYAPSSRAPARESAASKIVANLITIAADQGSLPFSKKLHRANAQLVMDRAREYIDAHLREAIRIMDICQYAGTNLRTLERIFAREVDMSPKQYVQARRLNSVRRRLLQGDRDQGRRVTAIALNHGFTHLGRFASDYRQHFGEYPLETLRGH